VRKIKDPVNTPFGTGTYQGEFSVHQSGKAAETVHMVEIPVTDSILPHLSHPDCLTPHAKVTAQFLVQASDLS